MSVASLRCPSLRTVFEAFTKTVETEALTVVHELTNLETQSEQEMQHAAVSLQGCQLRGNITQLIRIGLCDFNVQEEWFQSCFKTLCFARRSLENCSIAMMGSRASVDPLNCLEFCITAFLAGNEDDVPFQVFENLPEAHKKVVYSSVSSQLYDEPYELTLGQDHFYMSGISTITKVQALVAAWKVEFTRRVAYSSVGIEKNQKYEVLCDKSIK